MLVTFDGGGNMRDFYYPYVGQWNHIQGNKNSLGIWVEGRFSWVDEGGWDRKLGYIRESSVTSVQLTNKAFELSITVNDAVHHKDNIYLKRLKISNNSDRGREIRVFFTHDFSIDETEVGDTAAYEPTPEVLYHYKKGKYFLVNGFSDEGGIFQYATGTKRFGGAEGTWRDAEDGHLQGNPIAQGSVDSTVSFKTNVPPHGQSTLYYWIAVGRNFKEVCRLNDYVIRATPQTMFQSIEVYWRQWVNKFRYDDLAISDDIMGLYRRSLLVIRSQIDNRGAIIAANDSDVLQYNRDHYSYCWPRDGALISYALICAGYPEMTRLFFEFCAHATTPEGFLLHKYNPDGSAGSSWHPWLHDGKAELPIQEDETGLVLFALWQYFKHTRDIEFVLPLYRSLIIPAANFMAKFIHQDLNLPCESWDLWEERRGIFTFTASAVYAGLVAAANFADLFADSENIEYFGRTAENLKQGVLTHLYDHTQRRFIRGLYLQEDGTLRKDLTLESSVYGVSKFGLLPPEDERVRNTIQAVEKGLWVKTSVGGIARYHMDYYFSKSKDTEKVPGNPWFICTLWITEWYIDTAKSVEDLSRAIELLKWVVANAMSSGVLPEQLHPYTGEALSVAPLTWSHSSYVLTVQKLINKLKEFSCSCPVPNTE